MWRGRDSSVLVHNLPERANGKRKGGIRQCHKTNACKFSRRHETRLFFFAMVHNELFFLQR